MSLNIVVTADVAAAGKQIDDFSKKSRTALTSLSLVAQDLPFGFIGIQNNLPGVISSFGELTREAGGVGGALKQLGSSLVGPAGLFLAFSVVTSAVTMLTLKYGSLGAAFDAIFGKTTNLTIKIKKLSDSYAEFNKNLKTSQDISNQEGASLTGTIAKIESLTLVILDQTKSYNERNAALNTLKDLDKERFGNLDLETLKINTLTTAVDNYTNSLIAAAVTKGFEEEISRTSVELSKQVSILKQLDEEKKKAIAAPQKIVGKAELVDRTEIEKTESAYNKQLAVIRELTKRKNELSLEIRKSIEAQIALKAPIDAATAALEKQKKADQGLKKEKEWQDKWAKSWYKNNGKLIGQEEAFSKFVVGSTNLQVKAIDKLIKARVKYRKETSLEKATELVPKVISGEAKIVKNQKFLDAQAIAAEFAIAKELIDGVFFNPIQELFENFINTGKFAFDEFAKNIKANIAKIVAQIAASKIIELLGTIFAGPIAGAIGGGSGGAISGFLKSLTGFLPTFTEKPSFDGVRGANMGMTGAVNLVLRGTDLVGSINRTNSQISRVG